MKDIDYKGLMILREHVMRSDMSDDVRINTLAAIPSEVFRSEYGVICEDIREHADKLADAMEDATKSGTFENRVLLDEVEEYRKKLHKDFDLLEKYHAEFLRRYSEKRITDENS